MQKSKSQINFINKLFDNFHVVRKNVLYRSKQLHPRRLAQYVKKYNIKTVINLRGVNRNSKWWREEYKLMLKLNVRLYNIPMSAQRLPKKEELAKLLYIYQHAPRPILIHCKSGSDRTGEAAAMWVLHQEKKGKKKAMQQLGLKYGHIKKLRPSKQFLIKIWKSYDWFLSKYNPKNYPKYFNIPAKKKAF